MLTRNDSIILSQQVDVQKRKPLLKRTDFSGKEQSENGCSFLLIIASYVGCAAGNGNEMH